MKKIFLALCLALCAYAWGDEFLTGTELSGDGWRGLDLGQPFIITQVGWNPTSTTTAELGLFEGANSPDFMDALPLYMHDGASEANTMNYADVNCSRGFRYVRYRKSDKKAEYRIAELAFAGIAGEGDDSHLAQLTNYLGATKAEVGLLLNFGPTPEKKHVVFTNDRKTSLHNDEE